MADLFSGPDDDVWEVSSEFHDQVTLIDVDRLTTQNTCPLRPNRVGLRPARGTPGEHRDPGRGGPCCGVTVHRTLSGTTHQSASHGFKCA